MWPPCATKTAPACDSSLVSTVGREREARGGWGAGCERAAFSSDSGVQHTQETRFLLFHRWGFSATA